MERSIANIKDAISPYSRFVRAEQAKLDEVQTKLENTKDGLERLKVQVGEVVGTNT